MSFICKTHVIWCTEKEMSILNEEGKQAYDPCESGDKIDKRFIS